MQRYLGKKNFPFIKLSSRIISDYQGKLLASIEAYEEIVAYARKKQAETGSKLLWGTANVFGHARYMNGAATNPDFDVVARAAVQIKNALDATIALGGENYVFWGGREGYMSLLNTDQKREKNHLALLLAKAWSCQRRWPPRWRPPRPAPRRAKRLSAPPACRNSCVCR